MIVGTFFFEGIFPEKRVDVPPASFAGLSVGVVARLEAQEAHPNASTKANIEGSLTELFFIGLSSL